MTVYYQRRGGVVAYTILGGPALGLAGRSGYARERL